MLKSLAPLLALLASSAAAWDPSERDCSDSPLCLTSFIWCDQGGSLTDCSFPDGAYSISPNPTRRNSAYAMLIADRDYTITWKTASTGRDEPVQVSWRNEDGVAWQINTTETQVTFNPADILASQKDKPTFGAVHGQANTISISQARLESKEEYPREQGYFPNDNSDFFMVGTRVTEKFLTAQNEIGHMDESKKWKLGVGIGAGVGVPLLMTLSAVGTWVVVKKRSSKTSYPSQKGF